MKILFGFCDMYGGFDETADEWLALHHFMCRELTKANAPIGGLIETALPTVDRRPCFAYPRL